MRFAWIKDLVVRRSLSRIEALIESAVPPSEITAPVHQQLLARRSKRLRSALLLLSARCGTMWPKKTLEEVAAGIELLHEATLYHDDIVDLASVRRGQDSAHLVAGAGAAARAGADLLFATPRFFLDLSPQLRRSAGRAAAALCWGQLGELENLENLDLSPRRRLRIMRDKTARLFAFAASTGASLAAAPPATTRRLHTFGLRLGLCFQLADDLRDLLATEEELGREPGADLRDGVFTLPILHGLSSGGAAADRLRDALWAVREGAPISSCLQALQETGGIRHARATLDAWLGSARLALSEVDTEGHEPALQSLDSLVENLRASVPAIERGTRRGSTTRTSPRGGHVRL